MNYLKCSDCTESKGDRAGDAPVPHADSGVSGGSVQSLKGLNGAGVSESPSPSRLKLHRHQNTLLEISKSELIYLGY